MLTSLSVLEGYGYMNKQQLFDVVKYYRDRKIPLDGLHIDVPLQARSPPPSSNALGSNVPVYILTDNGRITFGHSQSTGKRSQSPNKCLPS
jgi:hypothetical protein